MVAYSSAALLVDSSHVLAQRQAAYEPVPILRSSIDGPNPDGSYAFSFETGNGIKADEQGELKPGGEEGIASVRGSYSYQADDGTPISLTYTADENGFQPQGAHLPVAPPIPEAILKALEWIAAHPEEDNLKK
jgi:hypothetical protein